MKSRVLSVFNALFSHLLYKYSERIASWVIAYIDLHIFITAISIPILAYWGMPLSLLTIVGNFLFAPVCTLFLWLSALIYIAELVRIPNQYIITLLDQLRRLWEYCLTFGSAGWLVGFRHYHIILSILFVAIPICILVLCSRHRQRRMLILSVWIGFLYAMNMINSSTLFTLKTEYGEFHCASYESKIIVVDPGILLKSANPDTFFAYHGAPALAKKCGKTTIDYYILLKPSIRSFQALIHAFERISIKTIVIPVWSGTASKKMWHCFFKLKNALESHESQLIRISSRTKRIPIGAGTLIIRPLETNNTVGTHTMLDCVVHLKIDNRELCIYDSKKNIT